MLEEALVATLASTGTQLQRMSEAGALGVIIRCAICGYQAVVLMPESWQRSPGRIPQVWFCDDHRKEWHSHEEN